MEQLNMFFVNSWTIIPVLLWALFWKGTSLWISAKSNQKWWFLLLLVFNTAGILDIIYIFFVAKKKWSDVKEVWSGLTSSPNK